ncbi:carbon-nitrogen hydrolase [Lepidopterella palustris CBS 459.81]|uniref:Carbon-nitrogen hydrolase n=1 Tax=Lepidopterella palustris CBS 459.81 TaxID=1314670 RepID=A0A8E2JB62_9PEZI|nr:carbon-nitrogen hydrolase [Lepidopterella palustris CBS 459.81]
MKIACLQFAPEMGQVEHNMRRANEILSQTNLPSNLDWLVLPEMAFSGYNFQSLEAITPYLELTTAGPSTQWAIQTALRLRCHVTVGYPETTVPNPSATTVHYNSTVTISPIGQILANYRKTFLFYNDEIWARESPSGFFTEHLGTLGRVALGICMDINPYKFTAPWDAMEFASAAVTAHADIVSVSMAWISRHAPEDFEGLNALEPDMATMTYWIQRMQPLVDSAHQIKPLFVVFANRCGHEGEVYYSGSSTIMKIDKGGVWLYQSLGRDEERCLIVDTAERPKFQVRDSN